MKLYIIRHAQSTNNALVDQSRRVCDPSLTELGWRQTEKLAAFLGAWAAPSASAANEGVSGDGREPGIDRLLCSPMRRALETAQPVARALGLTPEVWVDLHEMGGVWLDHGADGGVIGYPGMAAGEIAASFPGYRVPETVTDRGWWQGAHEDDSAAQERVVRVADELRRWPSCDERIALLTHGAFSSLLLRELLGQSLSQSIYYHLDNTSISLIRFRPNGALSVRYLNRVDHLPPEMVS